MKRNIIFLASALTAVLLTTSCSKRTHDSVSKDTDIEQVISGSSSADTPHPATAKTLTAINNQRSGLQQVTGKMALTLRYGDKSIGVSGNLKMKRNDVIQLSLQFLGFMEVGRIELTQDYMLILNRQGNQYMKASYSDIPYFKQNGISFYTFQSLFWNELFCLGGDDKEPSAKSFTELQQGEKILLSNATRQVALQFLVGVMSSNVQQTTITPSGSATTLQWDYSEWSNVSSKRFPSNMTLSANYKNAAVEANIKLSRLRTDEKWTDTRTTFNEKKYKQITLQQALAMITSLAN